jgi:hypothetical protein
MMFHICLVHFFHIDAIFQHFNARDGTFLYLCQNAFEVTCLGTLFLLLEHSTGSLASVLQLEPLLICLRHARTKIHSGTLVHVISMHHRLYLWLGNVVLPVPVSHSRGKQFCTVELSVSVVPN